MQVKYTIIFPELRVYSPVKGKIEIKRLVNKACVGNIREEFVVKVLLWYLVAITVVTFCVCGWDKLAARRQMRRVPEKVLFLLSAIGGSVGMYAGMLTFRHKTQHWYFKFGIPAIIVIQAVAVMLVLRATHFPLN